MDSMKKLSLSNRISLTGIVVSLVFILLINLVSNPKVCAHRDSVGRNFVGTANREQQAYHFEYDKFLTSIQDWQKWMCTTDRNCTENKYWDMSIQSEGDIAYSYATAKTSTQDSPRLYSYVGAIYFDKATRSYYMITCRTSQFSTNTPTKPTLQMSKSFIFWKQEPNWQCSPNTTDC